MSIIYNGTTVKKVTYNGEEITNVNINGTSIFEESSESELIGTWTFNDVVYPQNLGTNVNNNVRGPGSTGTYWVYDIDYSNTNGKVNVLFAFGYGRDSGAISSTNPVRIAICVTDGEGVGPSELEEWSISSEVEITDSEIEYYSLTNVEEYIVDGFTMNDAYKTITITGGNDVNDSALIQWFKDNASKKLV